VVGLSVNSSVSYLMMDAISGTQVLSMSINSALNGNQWYSAALGDDELR